MKHLDELNAIHLTIDRPERTVTDSEPECVLRLRKVAFHVRAVVSWFVDTDILHVIGPDIRAARAQLEPLVVNSLYIDPQKSESMKRRRYVADKDKGLVPFSHPTLQTLIHRRDIGGLGKTDVVVYYCKLYELLIGLVCDYGLGLGVIADALDRSKQSEILDLINRSNAEFMTFPAERLLRFAKKVD